MIINQDGSINKETNAILLTGDRFISLDENQFFQVTPTGKRIELWEGKSSLFNDGDAFSGQRICYWNKNSMICEYKTH